MEYVHLGRTGLLVSPLCLGTMNFGWESMGTEEPDAFGIMDRAVEYGINFFDTANVYGVAGRGTKRRGDHRADPRALVRAGRRPSRPRGARDEGV